MRLSRQGPSLCVRTPAKINLSLDVLGCRQDGYHDLETVMVAVRLFDTLTISPGRSNEIELDCRSASRCIVPPPADDGNLVLRAARLLRDATSSTHSARITLHKRIPTQAGMGGGSSDAAATLVGLNQLWNLGLSQCQLHDLAARLGSDVNFFLDSPTAACCTGRGENIVPLSFPRVWHFVVIKPPVGLSTAEVFKQWRLNSSVNEKTPPSRNQSTRRPVESACARPLKHSVRNDLQAAARQLAPQIENVLARLERQDVVVSGMTGSGSACFAVCRSYRQAQTLAARCRHWNLGSVWAVASGA